MEQRRQIEHPPKASLMLNRWCRWVEVGVGTWAGLSSAWEGYGGGVGGPHSPALGSKLPRKSTWRTSKWWVHVRDSRELKIWDSFELFIKGVMCK